MRARAPIGMAAAAGAVLAGCGSSQLDTTKAEKTIRTLTTSKLGVPVASVKCPKNVKLKTGLVTVCQVTLASGETEPFTITQRDAKGNVHIQPIDLIAGGVERTINQQFARRGVKTTTTCPQHVPIRVGATTTCRSTDAKGASLPITVTITDSIGAYRLRAG
ncbi:MAG: hypothetical protein QOE27_1591 [Solirubrobacteraceae bacterium]|nr:hypothetical protein [Solirubrobacteraceae bacterium]